MRFKDKVVVITGAAAGIGKAAARLFAAEGANVVINDLRADVAEAAAAEITSAGGKVVAIPGDISDETKVQSDVTEIIRRFGHIDVLLSNAGVPFPSTAVDYTAWERSIGVNLSGHFYWARAVAKESMIPNKSGNVVFTSSGAGLAGVLNDVGYVASKHAIIGLTKALALEWAEFGIRVNCVAPGVTGTEIVRQALNEAAYEARISRVPIRRMGDVEDIARTMMFLVSDDAAYITGTTINVDGGQQALHSGMSMRR